MPPSEVNRFLNTGTMKTSMAVKMSSMTLQHHGRVGHGRPDRPVELACFSMVVARLDQHLVQVSAGLTGLDQGAEQVGEDLRVLGAGGRQRRSVLEVEPDLAQDPGQLLFSAWAARMPSDRTTDRPESTMVDSCRVIDGDLRQLDPVGESRGS